MSGTKQSRIDKFKEAAGELETDDDPERFNYRLATGMKLRPVEKSAD